MAGRFFNIWATREAQGIRAICPEVSPATLWLLPPEEGWTELSSFELKKYTKFKAWEGIANLTNKRR